MRAADARGANGHPRRSAKGLTGKGWAQGDFTFDGAVNLLDFNRLTATFGGGGFGPDGLPPAGNAKAAADAEHLPEGLPGSDRDLIRKQ